MTLSGYLRSRNLFQGILRCFVSRNNDLLVRVFVVYVRPILEYNSVIWSPSLVRDIQQLEKVQRRFTKISRYENFIIQRTSTTVEFTKLGTPTPVP